MINLKPKNNKSREGFTLIETLVALGIFLFVMIELGNFARSIFNYNSIIQNSSVAEDEAKQTLEKMASEMRSMYSSDTGSYAIGDAGTSTITFYSDINNDGKRERIRYFLSGTTLEKGITVSTGSPLSYDSANETFSEAIHNVNNSQSPIFEYFDGNYDGSEPPLSQPVNISSVRHIKITLNIVMNNFGATSSISFSTDVTPRNLKDNL